MDTAVDRFLGRYPTARLGLAAIASIVVLADLIVLVGDTAAVSEQPAPAASSPALPPAVAPAPSLVPSEQAPVAQSAVPVPSVPAPTVPIESERPRPTATPTRTAPAPAETTRRPRPTTTRRSHSPFEERCRDGEIQPWLCHGLPN
jgi:hypothetical protein